MKFRLRRLFDRKFYLESNKDVRDGDLEPWQHFCEFGHREDRDPHPLFSTRFYRKQYMNNRLSDNPLIHYLWQSNSQANTHPLFDANFYADQVDEDAVARPQHQSWLEHFLATNQVNLASPSPLFDTRGYLQANPEIAKSGINALYHYVRFGRLEEREPFLDWQHIQRLRYLPDQYLNAAAELIGQQARLAIDLVRLNPHVPTMLCVSQFADDSDSALRTLHLAQRMREIFHVNVVNLLCQNGPLQGEFLNIGPTFCFGGTSNSIRPHVYARRLREFKALIRLAAPVGIIANSVTSQDVLGELANLRIPISLLVDEKLSDFPLGQLDAANKLCQRIVFTSHLARQSALENSSLDPKRIQVIQPGLPESLVEQDDRVQLRNRLEISNQAKMVLGCGDDSMEKGFDLFVSTAISALYQDKNNELHFAWAGNSDDHENPLRNWSRYDVELAGFQDRISFLGGDANIEQLIECCDIFFLASRSDAFPTAVMRAMSAGKPVVLFSKGNGSAQLVTPRGGAVVPYGDTASAASNILQLANHTSLRKTKGMHNRVSAKRDFDFSGYVSQIATGIVPNILRNSQASCGLNNISKRRVIFCSPSWSVSGVNTFVEDLGKQLEKRGFDVSILFTTVDSARLPLKHLPSLRYHYLSNLTLEEPVRRKKILSYLKVQGPSVVIPNFDYVASSVTTKLPDYVRTLGILHSDQDEHYLHAYRMGHNWQRIVSVSNAIHRRLLNVNPGFAGKTSVIRYGIPLGPMNHKKTWQHRISDQLRLIYTGRLVQQQKRIFDFVELAKSLHRRELDFLFTFVGEGQDETEFIARMQPFIKRNQVQILGRLPRSAIFDQLQRHHAFCLLSDYEGLPLSMLEAMATECVPVVTKIESGISEILSHYHNALISPLRDIEKMADNIQRLHDNVLLRRRLGMRARTTLFRHRLTSDQMADAYAGILNSIHDDIESGKQAAAPMPLDCRDVQHILDAA